MFHWMRSVLREEAGNPEGGGTATVTETAEQIELRELKAENARLKQRGDDAEDDAKEWARIARTRPAAAEPVVVEKTREATEEEVETGEKFLDDVSKDGLAALRKRGFVRMDEVKQLIEESIERAQGDGRTENQFQAIMQDEFPEMAEDLARLDKGLKPQHPIFIKASEIYRDAIGLDPDLKGSKSALIMATRQAAAQLSLEGKYTIQNEADRQATRRSRIDAQRPDRSTKSDATEETGLTDKQRQFAKDMGISEEKYLKQVKSLKEKRG